MSLSSRETAQEQQKLGPPLARNNLLEQTVEEGSIPPGPPILSGIKMKKKKSVIILIEGPKAGQVFMVPFKKFRKLALRRAEFLLLKTGETRAKGFIWGFLAGASGHPWISRSGIVLNCVE